MPLYTPIYPHIPLYTPHSYPHMGGYISPRTLCGDSDLNLRIAVPAELRIARSRILHYIYIYIYIPPHLVRG